MFTHYEDTKGNAKSRNWGGWQLVWHGLGSSNVIGNITIRYNAYIRLPNIQL